MVYRMQVLQELTRTANANGHNTIFLTDLTGPERNHPPVANAPLKSPSPPRRPAFGDLLFREDKAYAT